MTIIAHMLEGLADACAAVGAVPLAGRIRAWIGQPNVTFITAYSHTDPLAPEVCNAGVGPDDHQLTLDKLAALPSVAMDFSTPEGAIRCLENAQARKDLDAAAACRDFEAEARVWLRERGESSEERQLEMVPEMTKVMERAFLESEPQHWPSLLGREPSYFIKREPYGSGLVDVTEVSVKRSDGSMFWQHVLVSETPEGWRVVTPLVKTLAGWRVTKPKI
jgi:hypothetical protein